MPEFFNFVILLPVYPPSFCFSFTSTIQQNCLTLLLLLLVPIFFNLNKKSQVSYHPSISETPERFEKNKIRKMGGGGGADKPSRGLVLFGGGMARFVNQSHIHLHSLAAKSLCGFLSLPHFPENVDDATVGEFLNLIDAYEDYTTLSGDSQGKCITPSISERFMGVRAALITENTRLKSCGSQLGFSVLQPNELINNNCSLVDSPVNLAAIELLNLLGFQDEKVLDTSQFDLVFMHVGSHQETISKGTEYVNALVGEIISIAEPKSQIGSRLHLSVVLTYGDISKDDASNFLISNKSKIIQSGFASLYPRQSYTMKGSNLRNNVRDYCPMLLAQWQDAVTRKDMVETFSFQDFMENGGNLTIPADRFLHEVSFKLWKAPKYGA
uniref:uncharacterized protein LOC122578925 n=1 Tax=Erigeron canadensis TaxID=72917 RepID=UPI001CB9096B|nr:uncharacterized protein LOC122578925 [Erigeron canadensis]